MNASPDSPTLTTNPPVFTERSTLLVLLGREWRLWGGTVVAMAMIWVIGLWVLVLFSHPAWLLGLGLCHVMLLSSVQAGRDVIDGTEEFAFAQPPGRSPLYVARMIPGLVFLAANGLLGWLAICYSLPQRLWAVVFTSGLTEPFAPVASGYWYAMAVLLPLAAHAVAFALAANAKSRGMVNAATLTGIIAAAIVMLAGFYLETLLWQEANGLLAGPALLVTATLVLLGGHLAYQRKEATASGGTAGRTGNAGLILIIIAILLLLLAMFLMKSSSVRRQSESEKARAMEERERVMHAERMKTPTTAPGH